MKRHWSRALLAGALALTLLAAPAQAIQTADSHGVQTVDSGAWFNEKNFPAALYPTAILYSYGLVNGAGTDQYGNISTGVDQPLTRQEAVTLLVRLLGLEEEAKSGQWDTPFTDLADWAAPCAVDLDGDGRLDIVLGTFHGYVARLERQGSGYTFTGYF